MSATIASPLKDTQIIVVVAVSPTGILLKLEPGSDSHVFQSMRRPTSGRISCSKAMEAVAMANRLAARTWRADLPMDPSHDTASEVKSRAVSGAMG